MREFFLNMNEFFIRFEFLNMLYMVSVILTFYILLLIIKNRKRISNLEIKKKKQIRMIFGCILVLFYILRRGTFIYYEVYNWKYHLDLGFCNMTNMLFIIYCFTGSKKLYNICYYCAFCGPLLSIIFPVINISINNFSFINFIMIHHVLFLMNLIFAIFENHHFDKKNFTITCIFLLVYLLFCYIFNIFFNTNYNFLNQLVISSWQYNVVVQFIIKNKFLNYIILVILGIIMSSFGVYILKMLDLSLIREQKN